MFTVTSLATLTPTLVFFCTNFLPTHLHIYVFHSFYSFLIKDCSRCFCNAGQDRTVSPSIWSVTSCFSPSTSCWHQERRSSSQTDGELWLTHRPTFCPPHWSLSSGGGGGGGVWLGKQEVAEKMRKVTIIHVSGSGSLFVRWHVDTPPLTQNARLAESP